MTANNDGSISTGTLHKTLGGGSTASEGSNHPKETAVLVSEKPKGRPQQRHRYSIDSLRALRHKRRFALPQNIAQSWDARRPKIPTLKPNPPTPFSALSLPKELLDALESLSLKTATPIQATAIPYARLGGDLVAQATSGTGKTLTYALVALDSILPATSSKSALIIVPARELASQVAELFTKLSGIRVVTLVGGTKESIDEERLSKPVNVVVGTPGRVEAMVSRGSLNVGSVKVLVLDEADRLLDGSFGGSVERICNTLPPRQTLAISATFSYSFKICLLEVMREPAWIGGSQVVHSVIQLKDACYDLPGKIGALKSLFQRVKFTLCLVFFNAKKAAARVAKNLTKAFSFHTKVIHAGMTQKERDGVIRDVRQGMVRVLVTTDVLARGIDFDTCDLVVHMDVPLRAETYLHRVGRAGRFGQKGSSLLMFDDVEVSSVRALEEDLGYTIGSQLVLDGDRHFAPPEAPLKKAISSKKLIPKGGGPLVKQGGQKVKEGRRYESKDVNGEGGFKLPESPSKGAPGGKQHLSPGETTVINRGRQINLEGRQHDSQEVSGMRNKAGAKESTISADIPICERAQPIMEKRRTGIESEKVINLSDSPKDTNEVSPGLGRIASPSSVEETTPARSREQNSTAVNRIIRVPANKSSQPTEPKKLSLSFSTKRPRFPEEPTGPAKKPRSARFVIKDLTGEGANLLRRANTETVTKSPNSREGATTTIKKPQRKLFEWQRSTLHENGHYDAPENKEVGRVASPGASGSEQIDAAQVCDGGKERNLEKVSTSLQDQIAKQAHRTREPGTETGQKTTARETGHTDNTTRDRAIVSAPERAHAEPAQTEPDPSAAVPDEQHVSDDEDIDNEPMQKAPQIEAISEEYRDIWDRYAEDAYDTGYREAYEEAFRMGHQIRQRLDTGLE